MFFTGVLCNCLSYFGAVASLIVQLIICLQCRRPGFDLWVGKIPWRRERLPTLVFWPGEFHVLYSPWMGSQRVGHDWATFHFLSLFINFQKLYSLMMYGLQINIEISILHVLSKNVLMKNQHISWPILTVLVFSN